MGVPEWKDDQDILLHSRTEKLKGKVVKLASSHVAGDLRKRAIIRLLIVIKDDILCGSTTELESRLQKALYRKKLATTSEQNFWASVLLHAVRSNFFERCLLAPKFHGS